jgi:TRAP-type C4-dicarboxylate transport system substrate-binding protein
VNLIGASSENILAVDTQRCAKLLFDSALPEDATRVQVVLGSSKFLWDELPPAHRDLLTDAMAEVLAYIAAVQTTAAHEQLVGDAIDEGQSTPYTPDPRPSQDARRKWWRR